MEWYDIKTYRRNWQWEKSVRIVPIKQYNKNKQKCDEEKQILKAISNQNEEIANIIERKTGFSNGKPTQEMIDYVLNIKKSTEKKNMSITWLIRVLGISGVILSVIAMILFFILFILEGKAAYLLVCLVMLIPMGLLLYKVKNEQKDNVDTYNAVMGICSILSLIISIVSSIIK